MDSELAMSATSENNQGDGQSNQTTAYSFDEIKSALESCNMGSSDVLKLMTVQIDRLRESLQASQQDVIQLGKENKGLGRELKKEQEERARLQQNMSKLQQEKERLIKKERSIEEKSATLQREHTALKKELECTERLYKQAKSTLTSMELKTGKILEENRKLQQTKETIARESKSSGRFKQKIDELQTENSNLKRSNKELVEVFRKQTQLIENLKKQRMHLEAVKVLEFTEDEFRSAINMNTQ